MKAPLQNRELAPELLRADELKESDEDDKSSASSEETDGVHPDDNDRDADERDEASLSGSAYSPSIHSDESDE